MWTYHVHQKVVCIDDTNLGTDTGKGVITAGEEYVIRWLGPFNHWQEDQEVLCVRLVGVTRPELNSPGFEDHDDMPFKASRFRPLTEKKTDISVFTAMLTDVKQMEPA